MVKTFNNNSNQDYSTNQGMQYLQAYNAKKSRFSNRLLSEGSPASFDDSQNQGNVIEGFTGSFGNSKANIVNQQEATQLNTQRKQFDRALSGYAGAQKQLMEEAQMFVNNSSNDSASSKLKNQFIRSPSGRIGYVTDMNTYKLVPNPNIWSSIQGKNGCPANYTQVDYEVNLNGKLTGTDPNLFVGTAMQENQSCAPSANNLQVMGNTDPSFNKADWLGCYKNIAGNFEQQSDLPDSDDLEVCRVRAADLGRSAFYINNSHCYTAKSGVTVDTIKKSGELATVPRVSKVIFERDSVDNGAFGIMSNSQFGLGTLPSGASNFGLDVQNVEMWDQFPGVEGCIANSQYGGGINITSATWGANCNGQVKPWTMF
ncbi:MAG: hypothetical protein CMB96_05215 [Flavobacteriaceae bacterium]|nr:hypothetical protein [Flavobacteriaceae bacterium]|tara:strand:+ start:825 stop:1937 length:1113 start_codon:yes stop_codon:yes gene_type:complete